MGCFKAFYLQEGRCASPAARMFSGASLAVFTHIQLHLSLKRFWLTFEADINGLFFILCLTNWPLKCTKSYTSAGQYTKHLSNEKLEHIWMTTKGYILANLETFSVKSRSNRNLSQPCSLPKNPLIDSAKLRYFILLSISLIWTPLKWTDYLWSHSSPERIGNLTCGNTKDPEEEGWTETSDRLSITCLRLMAGVHKD